MSERESTGARLVREYAVVRDDGLWLGANGLAAAIDEALMIHADPCDRPSLRFQVAASLFERRVFDRRSDQMATDLLPRASHADQRRIVGFGAATREDDLVVIGLE